MTEDSPDQIRSSQGDDQPDWKPHGVSFDNFDEPLVLYPARGKAIGALNSRCKYVIPLMGIICMSAIYLHSWHWSVAVCYSVLFALTYLWVRRKHARAVLPVLEMRSDGIEIHSLYVDIFIPWHEIKEANSFTISTPHLGIVPTDLKRTLTRATFGVRMNAWLSEASAPLYKCFGTSLAPIHILESELPLSAHEVAEQINLRKAHALGLKQVKQLKQDE